METGLPLVRVLGIGHLAAAIRMKLHHLRLDASDMERWITSESAALFLACSDFENTSLRRSLVERARSDRATLLFACLHGHSARLGPLITPLSRETLSSHYLTRSWDFSRTQSRRPFLWPQDSPSNTHAFHLAQIGATFIIGELANLMYGDHTSLYDRVTKIDSPTHLDEWPVQVFPEIHPGTWVATETWPDTYFPTRLWHPSTP
jgi:hypothetical protein